MAGTRPALFANTGRKLQKALWSNSCVTINRLRYIVCIQFPFKLYIWWVNLVCCLFGSEHHQLEETFEFSWIIRLAEDLIPGYIMRLYIVIQVNQEVCISLQGVFAMGITVTQTCQKQVILQKEIQCLSLSNGILNRSLLY